MTYTSQSSRLSFKEMGSTLPLQAVLCCQGKKYMVTVEKDGSKEPLSQEKWGKLTKLLSETIRENPGSGVSLAVREESPFFPITGRSIIKVESFFFKRNQWLQRIGVFSSVPTYQRNVILSSLPPDEASEPFLTELRYESELSTALPQRDQLAAEHVTKLIHSLNFRQLQVSVLTHPENDEMVTSDYLSTWLETPEEQNHLSYDLEQFLKNLITSASRTPFLSIPIKVGAHYVQLLFSVDPSKQIVKSIEYYDSFGFSPSQSIERFIGVIQKRLEKEGFTIPSEVFYLKGSQQNNTVDCGLFSYLYVKKRVLDGLTIDEIAKEANGIRKEIGRLRSSYTDSEVVRFHEEQKKRDYSATFQHPFQFDQSYLQIVARESNKKAARPLPIILPQSISQRNPSLDRKKPFIILREIAPLDLALRREETSPFVVFPEGIIDEVRARTNWACFSASDIPEYAQGSILRGNSKTTYALLPCPVPVEISFTDTIERALQMALIRKKREIIFNGLSSAQIERLYSLLEEATYQWQFERIYIAEPRHKTRCWAPLPSYQVLAASYKKDRSRVFFYQGEKGKEDESHRLQLERNIQNIHFPQNSSLPSLDAPTIPDKDPSPPIVLQGIQAPSFFTTIIHWVFSLLKGIQKFLFSPFSWKRS